MADHTHIEWTDATWNPVTGCSVVSPGCTNCYAMKLAGTRLQHHKSRYGLTVGSKAGPVWNGEVRFNAEWLDQPLRWKRPRKIFVCAHGDLFHENVPDEWIDRVFAVMALCPQHIFQVLTKRPDRMRKWVSRAVGLAQAAQCGGTVIADELPYVTGAICHPAGQRDWPLPNVWLGVSVEDQARADQRREDFANTPAAIKFVSYEPALGPVDWEGWDFIDQIISGGESGSAARPSHPDWHRAARDFCAANDMAYFFKQWGEYAPGEIAGDYLDPERVAKGISLWDGRWEERWSYPDGHVDDEPDLYRVGKKRAGRLLDGVLHSAFPQVRA
ncbi:hypothetical protein BSL82_02440 [Tardibacter chloracetimidivorans]|uniref:Phage Gp37/Gp68 family protein n=1 Tax=Tardibacter chloracetimidivorans TaxID=1921510 RepID=A0A1L3ZRQ2_9SPHN|nr:phage Gp37/Gp68 family protein [Tardibacter chloracetimidivorans]API58306.1 hypothetical protein BSL82_02440 [Tardibacter chloracetimidivorans]